MLSETVKLRPADVRRARTTIAARLDDLGVDPEHVAAVKTVVPELLGSAVEAHLNGSLELSIELFPLLTSVRLRCPDDIELSDDPFAVRDRVLERLTLAVGRRRNADGTADLWAEVPVPSRSAHPS